MRRPFLAAALIALPIAAPAQAPKDLQTAARLITPAKVHQRISVIAHDSMGGRNTPSPGLEKTAQYLADNYRKWGFKPAGDNGTYFQRYRLGRTRADLEASFLEANEGGAVSRYRLDKWVVAGPGSPMDGKPVTAPVKVLAGAIAAKDVEALDLKGRTVLFVQNPARGADNNLALRAIRNKAPAAIILLVATDPAAFRTQVTTLQTQGGQPTMLGMPPRYAYPTITVHDSLWLGQPGAANRPDWNAMRASTTPIVMDAPESVSFTIVLKEQVVSEVSAPNVVAILEGSDPVLKHEYVVFSSHFDHVGTVGDGVGGCGAQTRPDGTVDNICNGADDDASGTTGLLMVAEAYGSLKTRPKRSIVILNVSGEEKGLLGSAYYAAHPTVPVDKVVANINMDMIGRNNPDSIVVIGKEHSDMGQTLATVQGRHPELKLVAADDIWPEQSFYSRSDHYNFARKGVPVLFFFNGVHDQYHRPSDEVPLIDTSKLARVAQLGFYFGAEIANTVQRPKWNPESYQTVVVEQKVPPATRRATP